MNRFLTLIGWRSDEMPSFRDRPYRIQVLTVLGWLVLMIVIGLVLKSI